MINENDLYYDTNEAVEFIKKETGLDEDTILAVEDEEKMRG